MILRGVRSYIEMQRAVGSNIYSLFEVFYSTSLFINFLPIARLDDYLQGGPHVYSLFSDSHRHYGGEIGIAWFKETSARIAEDVNHVVDYYHTGAFHVKTDHILVRLLAAMHTPLAYDLDHYYETASARALFVANSLEFTSAINVGRWFDGIFYRGSKELILAYCGLDQPAQLALDWKNLRPVKVLECPVSNMAYMLPNGHDHNSETGYAVIGIDIPALMVMYRCFTLEQRAKADTAGTEHLNAYHFVGKYVLPNMLYSQTDLVLFNRLMNLHIGAPMGESSKRHPFHISDYTGWLDRGLKETVKRVSTLRMEYSNILEQVPRVFRDSPLKMPDIAETRQVWWALFTTRFRAIQFLLNVAGDAGKHYNQALVNTLVIDLKRFKSENVLEKRLPPELYDDILYFAKHL